MDPGATCGGILGLVLLCVAGFLGLATLILWAAPYVLRWQMWRMKEILKDL